MAKKKADQKPAEVSPTPMVPIVIGPETNQILEQIQQKADQANQEQIQPIADQQPVEPLISQEQEPDQANQEQIQSIADQQPVEPSISQEPGVEEQPEKELTFAEKVIQKAKKRNGKRMVKVLADTITNLVNPVEKDDNPNRA